MCYVVRVCLKKNRKGEREEEKRKDVKKGKRKWPGRQEREEEVKEGEQILCVK